MRALWARHTLTVVGLLLFIRSYLVWRPLLHSFAEPPAPNDKHFSRLFLVVVDALRSDLAFGSLDGSIAPMSNVARLIESRKALAYTAKAQSPTVTLPRLKAITTGTHPAFLDAISNLIEAGPHAEPVRVLEQQDSWLWQLRHGINGTRSARRMALYGDDTWLRLFPPAWFESSDGVTSFMVTDTVTVDTNVTRHLERVLESGTEHEVDVLILHYLGLDHIGHLQGPRSPLTLPKQAEMDTVLARLWRHLEVRDARDEQKSLLVLIGDHGMTEQGNHGGSSEAETSAALLLASPSFDVDSTIHTQKGHPSRPYRLYQQCNQVDLVPTLSALLGLGMPANSLGVILKSALDQARFDAEHHDDILERNRRQLSQLMRETYGMESALSDSSANAHQDMLSMQNSAFGSFGSAHLLSLVPGLLVLGIAAGINVRPCCQRLATSTSFGALISAMTVFYLATLFASSFIEEEHEYWAFTGVTISLLCAAQAFSSSPSTSRSLLTVTLVVRVLRGWSSNGQKDTRVDDSFSRCLSQTSQLLLLLILVALTITLIALQLVQHPQQGRTRGLAWLAAITLSLVNAAQVSPSADSWLADHLANANTLFRCHAGIAAAVILVDGRSKKSLAAVASILVCITRPTNKPLFLILYLGQSILSKIAFPPVCTEWVILCVAMSSFFALGGSNSSLANVDLSSAYLGLNSYSPMLVSAMTFLSNYSLPVWWTLATSSPPRSYDLPTAFWSLATLSLCLSATVFREHLFVFSVFSPSLIFCAVRICLLHPLVLLVATLQSP
ncbi:uncharacterized protein L969DRAFT_91625 [Mixia osmundae IAM 14324]|uniref:GPI ethanolamine phosphate transferase 2 n=1 Tax=Mixia osmundae (strain CBS 9802 / IAM 14324 / JCM 22182 / KY 12970) TaxID=764103 RepID=G7E009_MIXOS|nr:uncharacterized protein L969DRAFT_91625 [Mixia osmundae IAM 14324]KEI42161.1 hypothetical protein L969DRAFT_91625 [Mixia osmundae IAM 14324]GAA96169.1 hypothetical protein E5Q_02831 [Mixia osmundae IAM 14324]